MAQLLTEPLVDQTLQSLPGWEKGDGTISREVHLPADLDAKLREEVELDSQAMGHAVQVEKTKSGTRFSLRTDEVGGVSELDVVLASRISDLTHRMLDSEPGVEAVRRDEIDVEMNDGIVEPPGSAAREQAGALYGKR
jgi:4a-hydroxytetrahydrobiopterin dehydratase